MQPGDWPGQFLQQRSPLGGQLDPHHSTVLATTVSGYPSRRDQSINESGDIRLWRYHPFSNLINLHRLVLSLKNSQRVVLWIRNPVLFEQFRKGSRQCFHAYAPDSDTLPGAGWRSDRVSRSPSRPLLLVRLDMPFFICFNIYRVNIFLKTRNHQQRLRKVDRPPCHTKRRRFPKNPLQETCRNQFCNHFFTLGKATQAVGLFVGHFFMHTEFQSDANPNEPVSQPAKTNKG